MTVPFETAFVETRLRVRYAETDQMGIVHHANYLVWFEVGRTDLCLATGISYAEIETDGALLVVIEANCRYRVPFRYDEEVVVRTTVGEAASRMMRFDYELYDAGGERRATGFTKHVWLDKASRRPVTASKKVMDAFAPYLPKPLS